jgi:hypothetical protein
MSDEHIKSILHVLLDKWTDLYEMFEDYDGGFTDNEWTKMEEFDEFLRELVNDE